MDLNNMPITNKNRKKYGNDIKNIYQMALNKQEASAIEYAKSLKNIMEKNLLLKRKIQYTLPATVTYILLILISYFLFNYLKKDVYTIILFSCIGGVLSLLLKQKDYEIDYKVDEYIIIIESLKRVLLTLIMGIIGYMAIKSKIVFADIKVFDNKYIVFLMLSVCGYSATFIPNILDSMVKIKYNLDEMKTNT